MFPFVPRKVAQSAKSTIPPVSQPAPSTAQLIPADCTDVLAGPISQSPQSCSKGKGKQRDSGLTEEDYAIQVCLSLSDHAIWSDPELRRSMATGEDGYIPLVHVLRRPAFASVSYPKPRETVIVKSIRAHASEFVDIRMRVSAPLRPTWHESESIQDDLGGYEVRRKDWKTAFQLSRNHSRQDWENRTIYMENIPFQHRSISGIYRFIGSMLAHTSPPFNPSKAVQNVFLPPHHLDVPGDQPKCKGFALVTLAQSEDTEGLLSHWPWDSRRSTVENVDHIAEAHEAVKSGFRTLSKSRWAQLQEQYIIYRQNLLDEIAFAEKDKNEDTTRYTDPREEVPSPPTDALATTAPSISVVPSMDLSSPYPHGCLVFVRNVHPETNKTTLRKLLSRAFVEDTPEGLFKEGLDYVDFNKGMDTCYLRLATPQHTQVLVAFFTANPTAQTQGLDSGGTPAASANKFKPITVEVVDGTREELYWNKVPEKIRRQAVEKAVKQSIPETNNKSDLRDAPEAEGKRKRKRRKGNP